METKPLSVTKKITRSFLVEKVLPAIRAQWPRTDPMPTIFIQQDNAKAHVDPTDPKYNMFASVEEFDIQLMFQPPNSPDLNVLDLGYFRAIQSLQYQEAPRNVDELVQAVEKSFYDLTAKSLDDIFLTLQSVMLEITKVDGGNKYKLPHMAKDKSRREGCLPHQLECPPYLLEKILQNQQFPPTYEIRHGEDTGTGHEVPNSMT